jgi:hypothetical protein
MTIYVSRHINNRYINSYFLHGVSSMVLLLWDIAVKANLIIVNSVLYIHLHFLNKVTMTPTVYVERTVFYKLLDAFSKVEKEMWDLLLE